MKAMILAAGRGERMRPLTDHCPKPLLEVGGKSLIQHQIERLRDAGITSLVINLFHLGEQIESRLGDGGPLGVEIRYSWERPQVLETGGGICQALPLLGEEPFLVVNADVWCDYPYSNLLQKPWSSNALAYLILVENPLQHPAGDFGCDEGLLSSESATKFTFSGIGCYHPRLFAGCTPKPFPLAPLLREAMHGKQVFGEVYRGVWEDVGTPQRLESLHQQLLQGKVK